MKVALCISGQPRFYHSESFNSIKREILDKYDTDVFIHSWVSKNKDFEYPYAKWSGITNKINIPLNVGEELMKLYKPKGITIEEPREFKHTGDINDYLSTNIPSMFYSMNESDKLRKKSKVKYDFIIRARTDTLFRSSIPPLELFDKNILYVPNNCPNPTVVNDNFSIAGCNVNDKCYSVFDYIDEYSPEEVDYSPEIIWTRHLLLNKITVCKINIDQNFVRS